MSFKYSDEIDRLKKELKRVAAERDYLLIENSRLVRISKDKQESIIVKPGVQAKCHLSSFKILRQRHWLFNSFSADGIIILSWKRLKRGKS